MVCDWWISIRFVYLCVSRLVALFLKSTVSFTLVLGFFSLLYTETWQESLTNLGTPKRASKSRGNTDTEGYRAEIEKEKENVHALPKDSGVPSHANVTTVEISFKLAVFPLHQAQEEREGELPFQPTRDNEEKSLWKDRKLQ